MSGELMKKPINTPHSVKGPIAIEPSATRELRRFDLAGTPAAPRAAK